MVVLSVFGISKLEVENSFINYFDKKTEIYKGMKLIDDKLGGRIRKVNNIIKIIAYIILIITAVSWGISGIILDTWDAVLWILAFLFIEMNIFKWQKDIDEKKQH